VIDGTNSLNAQYHGHGFKKDFIRFDFEMPMKYRYAKAIWE